MGMLTNSAETLSEARRRRMLGLIRQREYVRVGDLSETFGVSEVTIRNDLETLAQRGQIRRLRGGAMAPREPHPEHTFDEALGARAEQKQAIARVAASLVQPGESVILDVGSTTTGIAHAMIAREDLRDVTVFTNGLNIALDLEPYVPRFTIIVMGGTVRPMGHSLVDPLGEMLVERVNADIVFLACNGVDLDRGVTNTSLAEANTKRRLLRAARRRVLVADSAKIGAIALAYICDVEAIDLLITDTGVSAHALMALRERHVEVKLAREPAC